MGNRLKRRIVFFPILGGPFPQSRLCLRCRWLGYVLLADDASQDTCRGHLAEDRVNNLIGYTGG